jgi:hypothetical protein
MNWDSEFLRTISFFLCLEMPQGFEISKVRPIARSFGHRANLYEPQKQELRQIMCQSCRGKSNLVGCF